jgi:hypothetical protein
VPGRVVGVGGGRARQRRVDDRQARRHARERLCRLLAHFLVAVGQQGRREHFRGLRVALPVEVAQLVGGALPLAPARGMLQPFDLVEQRGPRRPAPGAAAINGRADQDRLSDHERDTERHGKHFGGS